VTRFRPALRFVLDDQNSDHPGDYWTHSLANLGRTPDIGKINSWASGHITWGGRFHHSWRFWQAEALRYVGSEMPESVSRTSSVPVLWPNLEFFCAIQVIFCRD
jgi:hypothetical protein